MNKLIVAITGASGAAYGIRLLEVLQDRVESHLILTQWARKTIQVETERSIESVTSLAACVHDNEDLSDSLASGSFRTEGMVIIPCSMRTLSAVATSQSATLVDRAADVQLKERRRLILCIRETPLHLGHIRLMESAAESGAIILPLMPPFYTRPRTIGELIDHTVGKVLDVLGIDHELFRRWGGDRDE